MDERETLRPEEGRGRWEKLAGPAFFNCWPFEYKCPECGMLVEQLWRVCPGCGDVMTGGGNGAGDGADPRAAG